MVIWFIGISGSGKTTLGNKLQYYFNQNSIKSFIIDGDFVRDFFDNDIGFSKEDRISNIKRIIFSAFVLEQNGIIPIICNISPFEEMRQLARKKFVNYHEIYLKKEIEKAIKDDVKKVYKKNLNKTELIGVDLKFDNPLHSDLVINVDDDSPNESFKKILNYLDR